MRTRDWQRFSRAEVAQVGQWSRTSQVVEGAQAQAQQVVEQCVSVEEMERCYSSPRSIQMHQSLSLKPPTMERPEAHVVEREGEVGTYALEVVVVDQLAQGQTQWQNVERVGVSQGQSFFLTISISITPVSDTNGYTYL
jgi:hypothetical protein